MGLGQFHKRYSESANWKRGGTGGVQIDKPCLRKIVAGKTVRGAGKVSCF